MQFLIKRTTIKVNNRIHVSRGFYCHEYKKAGQFCIACAVSDAKGMTTYENQNKICPKSHRKNACWQPAFGFI